VLHLIIELVKSKSQQDDIIGNLTISDSLKTHRIDSLRRETNKYKGLATRDVYRALSQDFQYQIINSLKFVREINFKDLPQINISCKEGTKNRILIANDLNNFFKDSGFKTELNCSGMLIGLCDQMSPNESLRIDYPTRLQNLVNLIFTSLKPWVRSSITAIPSFPVTDNLIQIIICGDPHFYEDGSIYF